jgi:hypothetical protein
MPLLLFSYRTARVLGEGELSALAAVPVPVAARLARFLGARR